MTGIRLEQVSFSYPGGSLAVDDVSMTIAGGENIAIIGQNGAGKTTTVKLMNGLLRPAAGDVYVGGRNTKDYTTAQISRVAGYVFQNPDDQIFHSTIEQEVRYGPHIMKMGREDELVSRALSLTELSELASENPYNLPLSVRKFVTIAAVLAMNTEIVIFDEPTAGQDLAGSRRLAEIIRTLHAEGKTVITISHDMEFVAEHFERVIVMANRRIVREGTPEEIFWDLEALEKAMLRQPCVSRILRGLGTGDGVVCMEDAAQAILKNYSGLREADLS